jgi:hypothetical protein
MRAPDPAPGDASRLVHDLQLVVADIAKMAESAAKFLAMLSCVTDHAAPPSGPAELLTVDAATNTGAVTPASSDIAPACASSGPMARLLDLHFGEDFSDCEVLARLLDQTSAH